MAVGNRGLWVQITQIVKVFFFFFFSLIFFLCLLICGANQGLFLLENLATEKHPH